MTEAEALRPGRHDAITDVRGIRVGHWTNRRGATGCTVIRCETCTVAAVDVRGGAPATHETDVLAAGNLVRLCHAIVFAGGSAFGLEATAGVARWLRHRDVGFETRAGRVPIVPGAAIFDLPLGRADAAPDATSGVRAAARASGGRVEQGSVGAGTGATLAKLLGQEHALKGGVGSASLVSPAGLVVGALAVTNSVGNVVDPATGEIVAGARGERGAFVPADEAVLRRVAEWSAARENTTLVCVATNAAITHEQAGRMAVQAHDGLARAIVPAHTFGDGDIAFAVATGELEVESETAAPLGLMAARTVERAIVKSVQAATALGGVPSAADWRRRRRRRPS